MNALVTGCAGFIGSNLVRHLLTQGHRIIGVDNLTKGRKEFLPDQSKDFQFIELDLLRGTCALYAILRNMKIDCVFHLAANADVRGGPDDPSRDLTQNTIVTSNVLAAMRVMRQPTIVFASTGSVYGEAKVFPTPEDAPFPIQTSLYAASKLACEGLISAYGYAYGFTGVALRLSSVLGENYTHGHIADFHRQLRADPTRLRILGDGGQLKQYVYVGDVVRAMEIAASCHGPFSVYNVGGDFVLTVRKSAEMVCRIMGVQPVLEYSGGAQGWIGDVRTIMLDYSRMKNLGWSPVVGAEESYHRTLCSLGGTA